MIDTTRVDNWSAVYDDDGKRIIVERAFLTVAIDIRTRVILAIVLSFDPPSILTLMACVKRIVRCKTALIAKYGKFKGATDGWGRPSTLILDNAWENVGLSLQVALEAAGINVEYAPVKTPQYKAYVERLFETLNTRLFHRLPSGIPEKPHVMAELGLNPRAKACRTVEWLEARIWDLVVTIYHVEKHDGIGMAPARAWLEQIKLRGRYTVDDVTVLDRFFGQAKKATLSASGVPVGGHRFHHGPTTTQLLDDLLRYDRQSRKKATGTVRVMVTIDQGDCSQVQVWNRRTRRHVMLPNVNAEFSRDLSWRDAKLIKEAADQENQAFHSDAEKDFQRARFSKSLEAGMRTEKFAKARRKTRTHQNFKGARLVAGDAIAVGAIAPSVTGLDQTELASVIPAQERAGSNILPKGVRRGGKKAMAAAASTRKRKAEAARKAQAPDPIPPSLAGTGPAQTAPSGFSGRSYDGALSLEQSLAFLNVLAAKNQGDSNGAR